MPLFLQTDTNPGDAFWGPGGGGSAQSIQKRLTLADMPAATLLVTDFDDAVPANAVILGATYIVTEAPAGGGVSTCEIRTGRFPENPQGVLVPDAELVGASAGYPTLTATPVNSLQVGVLSGGPTLDGTDWTPFVRLEADVNLNTLTQIDVTAYVFYMPLTGFTLPS